MTLMLVGAATRPQDDFQMGMFAHYGCAMGDAIGYAKVKAALCGQAPPALVRPLDLERTDWSNGAVIANWNMSHTEVGT